MNMGAIENIAHGAAHRAIYDHRAMFESTLQTEAEGTYTLLTLTPDNDTAGIIEVAVIRRDAIGSNSWAKLIASFEKDGAGVLTLGTPENILTPLIEGAGTITLTTDGGDIIVEVVSTPLLTNWKAKYDLLTVQTDTI